MTKFEQPEQPVDLDRYMASHRIRKPTAPASATFEITIESPPPSDPMTRLEELGKSTESLRARNAKHAEFNRHLDDVVERLQSQARLRKVLR